MRLFFKDLIKSFDIRPFLKMLPRPDVVDSLEGQFLIKETASKVFRRDGLGLKQSRDW